ncbi:MAG: NAD(P)/FAD-dependent oxidoreductase [Actinobacteria bacterium]|nr:NAD(P)/FAD-dependent oxidoreductase [Actinomycetota bacterium]
MGPGGEEVAGKLAEAGLTVVGIDSGLVGGECPYWGCIPSKMMIRAANLLAESRRLPGIAGTAVVHPDWAPVAGRIREEATDNWDDTVAVDRFEGKGGRFVRGHGRLTAADTVAVGDLRFRATRAVVLATGTTPSIPAIPGLSDTPYWTNHDVVEAKELPSSIVVLGGGAIGVELAQVLARFGVDVTIVEAAPRLLPLEEPEAGDLLADVLGREGVTVVTGISATHVDHDGQRFAVRLGNDRVVEAERLLVATGRRVDLAAIGADILALEPAARALPVDDHLRVRDGVWAVGDITGKGAFTHVAMYQANIVVADILDRPHSPADYHAVPRVTFTDPEVGSVGLSMQGAIDAGIAIAIGRAQVPSTARGWLHKAGNEGFIMLVADRARGVLVGATAMGPTGGEVLGLLALAVHAAVPIDQLRTMIYAYPTFHRGVEDALRNLA